MGFRRRLGLLMAGALTTQLDWAKANPLWASKLNPVLANLLIQGSQIAGIVLAANTPQSINHYLGKNQTGFFITDQNAAASIYRTQPFNDSTLTLEASANVTINLWVY